MIGKIAVYGVGEALNRALPFVFLPILSHYLGTEEFGVLFAYIAVTELLVFFSGLNVNATLRPKFIRLKREEFHPYVANGTVVIALSTAMLVVLAVALNSVVGFVDGPGLAALAPAMAGFQAINLTYLSLKQIGEQPVKYVAFSFAVAAMNFGLSLSFLMAGSGWEGRLYGIFLANAVMAIVALVLIARSFEARPSIERNVAGTVIRDGAKLLPYGLSWWARSSLDRLIILYFVGQHEAAIFASASQYSLAVLVAGNIANQAIMPVIMQRIRDAEQGRPSNLRKIIAVPIGLAAAAAIVVIGLSQTFFDQLMSAEFAEAKTYVLPLCAIFFLQAVSFFAINVLYYFERYALMSKIAIGTSTLHVAVSVTLVNIVGIWGAVIAGLISISLLVVLVSIFGASQFKQKE